ncbi:MAG: hypothetical protein FJ126_07765 [Deltaproteobacteria bacterium]|nr:hypothetical protein [Deltaproteobacteria bacterium]
MDKVEQMVHEIQALSPSELAAFRKWFHEFDASEHEAWGKFAARQLEEAYGKKEPDYSPQLIKEPNPEYKL